jgi:hypothetical protein
MPELTLSPRRESKKSATGRNGHFANSRDIRGFEKAHYSISGENNCARTVGSALISPLLVGT